MKYIVIAGDFFDGFKEAVGPFDTEEDAESYMESHNMGHFTKCVIELGLVQTRRATDE